MMILLYNRSRIVVKNLPVNEYIGKDELREIFSQKGELTHVRLLHNRYY
jgi:RNA recognition motif-containing protein